MTTEDFDRFRAEYDTMPFVGKVNFYLNMLRDHPNQKHYSSPAIMGFFEQVPANAHVAEMGGWDGQMASDVLSAFPAIRSWVNYEVCPIKSSCHDVRYRQVRIRKELWDRPAVIGDAFVASHSIEHNSNADVEKLIQKLETPLVYIDAPLDEGEMCWAGSTSSHVMTMGWGGLSDLLGKYGYCEFMRMDSNYGQGQARGFRK